MNMDTILHRLSQWAKEAPEDPAQVYQESGEWKTITARELCNRVYYLALFLESRGFSPADAGAIFSYNCPEWVQLDLANVLRGARSAGLYPNSAPRDIRFILEHTEAAILGVQNEEYFKKLGPLPESIRLVIVFDGDAKLHPRAVTFAAAIEEGGRIARAPEKKKLSEFLGALDPHAGLFMIYTSGTTGTPKGALLSLDNLTFTAQIASDYWELPLGQGSLFSFLPLCHIAEKIQNIGVGITRRFSVSFATRMDRVSIELPQVEPVLLLSVPRLWEKMMEGVLGKIEQAPGPRKKLALWALAVGARVAATRYAGKSLSARDRLEFKAAEKLVLA
jgi:long-chain acyl-CoA synthetase